MGFFFTDTKAAAATKPKPKPRLQDIPVTTLQKMGCSVCPRDGDTSLKTPKMRAEGFVGADVFLLTSAPTEKDDDTGRFLEDAVGRELEKAFGRRFVESDMSIGGVVQCAGPDEPNAAEIECCRQRVVADIEDLKPLVVVTVGDIPLSWATGLRGAIPHRGTLMVARIGNHDCYVFPLLYPNYVMKKKRFAGERSEYEIALHHDVATIKDRLPWIAKNPPRVVRSGFDTGIEIITGQEPGDMQRLEDALNDIARAPANAMDIETNCLRPFMHRRPLILTAACGTFERTVAFSLDHPDGWGSDHQRRRARGLFYDFLMNSGRTACHNLAFEMEWIVADGGAHVLRRSEWDDTMASAHTLDERGGTKALGVQTSIYFGFDLKAQSRVDAARLLDYPIKEALRYNGMDAKWTNAVRDAHAPLLDAVPGFRELYEDKVALAPTLALTTAKGLPVDQAFADAAVARLTGEAADIEKRLRQDEDIVSFSRRHGTFSPTNPDHMAKLLKGLGRKEIEVVDRRAGTTSISTNEEVLLSIGEAVPACALVLEHRSVSKLLGTYVEPTASGTNVCPDGMIRSAYNSMVTVTDRLSADDPAIQNWPKRKHKWVRGMVSVKPVEKKTGLPHWFVALDYGQIEFRVVGMASEDPAIVRACWTGYDVHKAWALRLVDIYPEVKDWIVSEFAVDWEEKGLKTLRQEMKNKWVFPQLFGSALRSCAEALHLPDWAANDLGQEFWDEFREVKKWHDRIMKGYEKNLYVEALTGARRRGPMSKNEAINMPIQSTAAAIVKRAMTALSLEAEMREDPELQPSLNVHDDLSTIMADATMEAKIETVARIMCEHRYDFINVPLVVEASVGPNWADLEEVRVYRSDELFNLRNPYS